jgi:nucleotide-binding universal stress UspA family protein
MPDSDIASNIILVAQDGSPVAQAAASAAIQIAQSQNLMVHGLYVVDETLILDSYANYHAELDSADEPSSRTGLITWFEKQGDTALHWLEARCQAADVPVTTNLLAGGVPELVLQQAAQAQLLALGRRGHGHADDPSHLGRNFRAIAHHAHCPILVGGDEQRPIRHLLLAYNDSENAQRALVLASILQRTLPAKVTVLTVQESADTSHQWVTDMDTRVAQSGLAPYDFITRIGQPATEIAAAAEENLVGLIVMGRYRHTAAVEWLLGSTVDRVLRDTPLPVLVA